MKTNQSSNILRPDRSLDKHNIAIFNSLPIGVGIYAPDGKMLYVNDRLVEIMGGDLTEFGKKQLNIFTSPALPDEFKESIRRGEAIKMLLPYNFQKVGNEGYYTSRHTTTRYVDCNGQPIIDADGTMDSYVLTFDDATDKVMGVKALRDSQRKSDIAMKSANITLWEFDVDTKLFYSTNERINNYDQTQPITIERYLSSIHPDDQATGEDIIRNMSSGVDFTFSCDGKTRFDADSQWQCSTISGSPYERDESGRITKYVGIRKNITELHKRQIIQNKILNKIPLAITIEDVDDDFRYIFCNDESKRLLGAREGCTTHDVMDESEMGEVKKMELGVFRSGKSHIGTEHIVLKDGRTLDTDVIKEVIEDDNDKQLLLNIRRDKSMEYYLERKAKLLSLLLENMNAFTWYYEPDNDRLNILDGFHVTGVDSSRLNSIDRYIDFIHPDDKNGFISSLEHVTKRDNEVWEIEYRLDLNCDGVYEWWESRGILETTTVNEQNYKYVFGMTICIESHKQAELLQMCSNEKLNLLVRQNELVLNNTNSGLAYIRHDYVVQWSNIQINSQGLSFESYKTGEFCYKGAHNRTTPCENCVMKRAITSRQTERFKFTIDGGDIVEVFATPVFLDDNTLDGVVIRVDNVTENELMINRLETAKKLAEESDILKSAFIANISHEIRTPLNAIVGFSELLMSCGEEDKPEYMRMINNNNSLLLKLINDILDLSKLESGAVEFHYDEFDLAEVFNNIAATTRQLMAANEDVKLVLVNPYERCRIKLDTLRLSQIMNNYLTNAIKFTLTGTIEMGYELRDSGVYLYVKDTGIGISSENKEKLFHRFEKLDSFAPGTGLGLSICKAIADAMGGSTGFESTYGEGSLFWALLPCAINAKKVKLMSVKSKIK